MSLADQRAGVRLDRQTIRSHARERLEAAAAGAEHARRVEQFRRFLKLETERLRMRQRMGLAGNEIATTRSYQIDQVVIRACQIAAEMEGPARAGNLGRMAVVAVGGYGRAELAPFSDVDLLFLHRGRRLSPVVSAFVEQVLLLLWDSGLTVGHSVRSRRECVSIARADLHSRTALSEARLVIGSGELFQDLLAALDGLLAEKRTRESFLEAMRHEHIERHARHGDAVCVQEPNVKEGVGGLRDLHTVLWVAHTRLGVHGLADLQAAGWIPEADHRAARRAYDFLLRVRNEAHFVTGRKSDLLTLDLQNDLASRLGFAARGGLLSSELFMREYYRRASELADVARRFLSRELEVSPPGLLGALRRRRPTRRLEVIAGRLHARTLPTAGGAALLEVFAVAQAEGVPLSDKLRAAIRARLPTVDGAMRRNANVARAFVDVLRWRGRVGPALRAMHETGFLGRYLPEFGRVSLLVQHDFYHRYTVDEHTLRTIEALDRLAEGAIPDDHALGRVFDEIEDAAPLYLGLLLHDIGKARGGAHVERGARLAPRVCERLGLDAARSADVVFLVEAHLEMSQISQQRDLSEPSLIASFADRVGRFERLNQLMLLTYADHRGVGPGIWNEWKARLLWELYDRTRERLAGHPKAATPDDAARADLVERLRLDFPETEIDRHLAAMPERYLRTTDATRMERHFRLVQARGDAPVALEWRDFARGHGTELTIVAGDRHGLFADIAGTLTANGVDILSVDLFSRADGVVIDSFYVSELPEHRPIRLERRTRVQAELRDAIEGRLDVARAVERRRARSPRTSRRVWGRAARGPSVRFDHGASAAATVIEVRAQDRPGLAWTIADTLARLGLDISFAKVATAKALALDVFYVTDGRGRKLEAESLPRVEAALLAALAERVPAHTAKEAR